MKLLALTAIPAVMFGTLVSLLVLMGNPSTAGTQAACLPPAVTSGTSVDHTQEQLTNAATIIKVGKARGVPPRGWAVALAAALQESSLRNLPYGDRDSAGLFQMRPSMGWGTFDQVTDPTYAATAFYGGPDVPPNNPGLLDVDGWQQMSITQAAQAVERSAYPDAYAKWVDAATTLVRELGDEDLECDSELETTCPPSGLAAEAGLTDDAALVVRCAVEHFGVRGIGGRATSGHVAGSDHYTGRAADLMIPDWQTPEGARFGDRIAAYYVDRADAFGITYIIWRNRIWSTARPSWRTYSHPDGRMDATALHMDHLHISVTGNASITAAKEIAR